MKKFFIPLILALLIVSLRIPNFYEPHWYDDEEIYLTIGNALRHGGQLYKTITDNKPPFLYWWVSINPSLMWLKLSITVFAILSAVFLFALVKAMKIRDIGQTLALISFVLLVNLPSLEGNIFNAELMFLPLVILSYYLAWQRKNLILTGFLVGCASVIKIPAAADFLGIIIIAFIFSNRSIQPCIKLCLGFLIPWVVVGGYFILSHSFGNFFYNSFLYNFTYIKDWGQITHSVVQQVISPLYMRIAILSFCVIVIYITMARNLIDRSTAFTLIWFFCSWFGSILSLRPYPHYLLQLAPSFSLMLAIIVNSKNIKTKMVLMMIVVTLVAYIYSTPFVPYRTLSYYRNWWQYHTHQISATEYAIWFDKKVSISTEVSDFIKNHASKTDKLFIWGNIAAIYSQTNLLPATPYPTDYLIHSYRAYQYVEDILAKSPPKWIVDCKSSTLSFPALNQLTRDQYFKVKSSGNCDLYHHRPLPMLQ